MGAVPGLGEHTAAVLAELGLDTVGHTRTSPAMWSVPLVKPLRGAPAWVVGPD